MSNIGSKKKIIIEGGKRLTGKIYIHGAKNSVLPILAAAVLNGNVNIIYDCPRIKDVHSSLEILKHIGCTVEWEGTSLLIDSSNIRCHHIPECLMREMRSSVIFLGAILSRCRKALISEPGGCELGPRPIDLHLKSLKALGVTCEKTHGYLSFNADGLKASTIYLNFPSVGATENIMLIAVMADGVTKIYNAAKEPEIVDLQNYLNGMGADVKGAGTSVIEITGVKELKSVEHKVIPDRIVAATYLTAAAITGGYIEAQNVIFEHIEPVVTVLKEAGCCAEYSDNSLVLRCPKRLRAVDYIRTMPHPGFPTDAQAQVIAMLSVADGTSLVKENIFNNRFKHTEELRRMGADIKVEDKLAVIRGVEKLWGAKVTAPDLRAGAALVVAGLAAEGITEISDVHHIERGYEGLVEGLSALGANIRST